MSTATTRPRPGAVLRLALVLQRRALLWWTLAIVLTALMFAAFYPSVRDSGEAFQDYLDQLPDAFKTIIGTDLTSPAGYLWSQLFSSIGPVVFLVYAIGAGARAIAGEEEAGSLDVLLSTPLRRSTVLRDKALAVVAGVALLTFVLYVSLVAMGPPFDMTVDITNMLVVHGLQALLAIGFGMIALAIGAATGRRSLALGATSAFAVLSYLVWALGPSVDALAKVQPLSPFRWFAEPQPLSNGTGWENVLVLTAIPLLAYVAARLTFERRDLGSA
ncbi:MAG: ABC transporter permease subunit [Actinomycetota bacterium]